jgi:hypothetical protein
MARRIAVVAVALILALAAGSLLFHVAAAPPAPMKAEEFARILRQVASLARETALLCEQIRDDRVTAAFARTHRERLEDELREQAEKLDGAVPPGLAQAAPFARELAAELAFALRDIKQHVAEAPVLDSVRGEAARIALEIERLAPR